MRLLADIGGTNVRFALLPADSNTPQDEINLQCADFRGLEEAVEYYLDQVGNPTLTDAAMDVATAITGDMLKLTNSPWAFSIEQARRRLRLNRFIVINDFTALALSLPALQPEELRKIGRGNGVPGTPFALLGAGTGLGVSALIPNGDRWIPIQGEGGHVAFSPMSDREDDKCFWSQLDLEHRPVNARPLFEYQVGAIGFEFQNRAQQGHASRPRQRGDAAGVQKFGGGGCRHVVLPHD